VKEQDYKWRRCVRIVNAYNGTTVKLSPEAFSKLIERVIPSLYNDVKVPAYMGIAQALSCAITGANPQTNIILKAALEEANKKAVDTHGTSGD
jgi:hypothetical protein